MDDDGAESLLRGEWGAGHGDAADLCVALDGWDHVHADVDPLRHLGGGAASCSDQVIATGQSQGFTQGDSMAFEIDGLNGATPPTFMACSFEAA